MRFLLKELLGDPGEIMFEPPGNSGGMEAAEADIDADSPRSRSQGLFLPLAIGIWFAVDILKEG